MFKKIGFIGCGNMGGALLKAAASSVGGEKIYAADRASDKAEAAANECGAKAVGIKTLAEECDLIFLGVKPQMMEAMLSEIRETLAARKDRFVLVTMAAGLTTAKIKDWAGDYPVIRIMPNLAASVGEAAILYCGDGASSSDTEGFLDVMKCAGIMCPLEEKLIDAGSAISGCGPAYAFMFIEALADGGVACGLPRDKAQLLAVQTLKGAAELLMQSGRHPGELKDAVCSPAGTTVEGVLTLEASGFRSAVSEAVISGYKRAKELK